MGNKLVKQGEKIDPQYLKVSGLYPSCDWDEKVLKKFILERKLAPCYPGAEIDASENGELEECPICFLHYPGGLNRSNCCNKPICTECYLQVKKQMSTEVAQCPFCKSMRYGVEYRGMLTAEEKRKSMEEDQRVIELQIKHQASQEEFNQIGHSLSTESSPNATTEPMSMQDGPANENRARASSWDANASSPHEVFIGNDDMYRERWITAQAEMESESADSALLNANIYAQSPQRIYGEHQEESSHMDGMVDMEEMMLMEAIRQSMAEGAGQAADEAIPAPVSFSDAQRQLTARAAMQLEQYFTRNQSSSAGSSGSQEASPHWAPIESSQDQESANELVQEELSSSIPDEFEAQLQLALALSLSENFAEPLGSDSRDQSGAEVEDSDERSAMSSTSSDDNGDLDGVHIQFPGLEDDTEARQDDEEEQAINDNVQLREELQDHDSLFADEAASSSSANHQLMLDMGDVDDLNPFEVSHFLPGSAQPTNQDLGFSVYQDRGVEVPSEPIEHSCEDEDAEPEVFSHAEETQSVMTDEAAQEMREVQVPGVEGSQRGAQFEIQPGFASLGGVPGTQSEPFHSLGFVEDEIGAPSTNFDQAYDPEHTAELDAASFATDKWAAEEPSSSAPNHPDSMIEDGHTIAEMSYVGFQCGQEKSMLTSVDASQSEISNSSIHIRG